MDMEEGTHVLFSSVTLPQMLAARESRAMRQRELLAQYPGTLICFTMNIAGPVKNSDRIGRGYDEGVRLIRMQLRMIGAAIRHFEEIRAVTGNEAFFAVDAEPMDVKAQMAALEDEGALGRLFDIDVLRPDGEKVSRTEVGGQPRRCLICDQPAAVCGSRRLHSVSELQARTAQILSAHFARRFADDVAALAQRSLLYEVCVTPKPGLVDRMNNGSHDDMDVFTFCDSASALGPYFRECAETGMRTADQPPERTFERLVLPGRRAEVEMARATGGVNTHKGAIYSMGVLCAALGRQYGGGSTVDAEGALRLCGDMTRAAAGRAFAAMERTEPRTAGHRLYRECGMRGIRGEVADGFPSVRQVALPALEAALDEGASKDEAGAWALLRLMAHVADTNMAARSNGKTADAVRARIAGLLAEHERPDREELNALDRELIEGHLSPGGCADLLAVAWMAHFVEQGLLRS